MEVKGGSQMKLTVCLIELVGTAMLLFSVNSSSHDSPSEGATIIAITLMVIIVITGDITGGHVNPAVTTAVLIAEGRDKFSTNLPFALMLILS